MFKAIKYSDPIILGFAGGNWGLMYSDPIFGFFQTQKTRR